MRCVRELAQTVVVTGRPEDVPPSSCLCVQAVTMAITLGDAGMRAAGTRSVGIKRNGQADHVGVCVTRSRQYASVLEAEGPLCIPEFRPWVM